MAITYFTGKVTFVNHEKQFVEIEFESGGRVRSITGKVDITAQKALIASKRIKRIHQYQVGDVVSFSTQRSEATDKMVAVNILFKHNEGIDMLINKAKTHPIFKGFIKEIDGKYFVKEVASYAFIPLQMSPWQIAPAADELQEFTIEVTRNNDKVSAKLENPKYLAAFKKALDLYKAKKPIKGTVLKATPLATHVAVVGDAIVGKLEKLEGIKEGDSIEVKIDFLSESKIVISKA